MHELAKSWIADFLMSNGFGNDFEDWEIADWADDLIDRFGLPRA